MWSKQRSLGLWMMMVAPVALAQTITISPSYPGVKVGTSVQLTAHIIELIASHRLESLMA